MTKSENSVVTAERIRAEFKKENFFPVAGKDVHMTVSIGIAQYKPQEDVKAFMRRVSRAVR
jgi:PleD family two-component response regulator